MQLEISSFRRRRYRRIGPVFVLETVDETPRR
jgi:hypothetical protein